MNNDLPTPVPASAIFNVLLGNPPFVILLKYSKYVAKQYHCYKIILNCKEELEKFYKKNGFSKSSIQMRLNLK